jgi:hypothetical protein
LTRIDDVVRRIEIPGTQSRIRIKLFSLEQCTKNDENKRIEKNGIEQQRG